MKPNLQACRRRAGYSSAFAFADAHGLNRSTYTDYEQGRIKLSLETAWELADLLDVSLDDLAGRDFKQVEYSDARQERLNQDFEALDDPSKNAAVAALDGMASACARGEASQAWVSAG